MTDPSTADVSRMAERGLRSGILAVLVVGVRRRNPGAVVNAVAALVASYLPVAVERFMGVELTPWQRLYATGAPLTHAVGMLGPYDDVWWWDHVTHAHSASILAAVVHTHARNRGRDPTARVLAVVAVVGLLWELVEYVIHLGARVVNLEPILINYGKHDTFYDLVFDLVGALLVLAFGDRLLANLRRD